VIAVQQNLISTGAFEVYYDGRTLFSKLATGAPPQLAQVVRAVADAHAQRAAQLAAE
jgi:hypothetical protein